MRVEMRRPATHYLRQARAKMRIVAGRELRDFMAGKSGILRGETLKRETLDAIEQAYAAGYRHGLEVAPLAAMKDGDADLLDAQRAHDAGRRA